MISYCRSTQASLPAAELLETKKTIASLEDQLAAKEVLVTVLAHLQHFVPSYSRN
jgi:hypothetical protein